MPVTPEQRQNIIKLIEAHSTTKSSPIAPVLSFTEVFSPKAEITSRVSDSLARLKTDIGDLKQALKIDKSHQVSLDEEEYSTLNNQITRAEAEERNLENGVILASPGTTRQPLGISTLFNATTVLSQKASILMYALNFAKSGLQMRKGKYEKIKDLVYAQDILKLFAKNFELELKY